MGHGEYQFDEFEEDKPKPEVIAPNKVAPGKRIEPAGTHSEAPLAVSHFCCRELPILELPIVFASREDEILYRLEEFRKVVEYNFKRVGEVLDLAMKRLNKIEETSRNNGTVFLSLTDVTTMKTELDRLRNEVQDIRTKGV